MHKNWERNISGQIKYLFLALIINAAAVNSGVVTLISPTGEESWDPTVRPTRKITWSAYAPGAYYDSVVDISYTLDGGNNYTEIVTGTPNDGSYEWELPDIYTANCQVKIYSPGFDQSDRSGRFTINYPVINIATVYNGQELPEGSTHRINFTYPNHVDDSVHVKYSVNGGTDWIDIKTLAYNDSCDWVVPSTPAANCLLRVEDKYCNDDVYTEVPFSIVGGEMKVTFPNSGTESFITGAAETVLWKTGASTGDVKIEYSMNYGSTWTTIDSSTENDGAYEWLIPVDPSAYCKIRVISNTDNAGDTSDNIFSIVTPPTITLTSPNGYETWNNGTIQDITWSSENLNNGVKIEYSTDSGSTWSDVVQSTANDGLCRWTIPDIASDNCLVRISDALAPVILDESDEVFEIVVEGQTAIVEMDTSGKTDSYGISVVPSIVKESDSRVHFIISEKIFGRGSIIVFDVLGQVIDEQDVILNSGGRFSWDLCNKSGRAVANGAYFVLLKLVKHNGTVEIFKTQMGIKRD